MTKITPTASAQLPRHPRPRRGLGRLVFLALILPADRPDAVADTAEVTGVSADIPDGVSVYLYQIKNLITPSRWFEPSPFSAIRYISFVSGIIALFTVAQWHWVKALGELGFYILLIVFYAGPLVAVDSLEQDTRKKIDEKENYILRLEAKIEEMKYENSTSNIQIQLDEFKDKEEFYKDEIKRLKSRVNRLLRE